MTETHDHLTVEIAKAMQIAATGREDGWANNTHAAEAAIARLQKLGFILTPAARWREVGQPDPHDDRYECERARLCCGHLSDDEIANAVFLVPSIGNLTAAKDRIRWLSRRLMERDL